MRPGDPDLSKQLLQSRSLDQDDRYMSIYGKKLYKSSSSEPNGGYH